MFFLSSPSSTLTIFPSFRIIVLLPYSSACFMLCVIMSVVIWFSFTILSVISMTEAAVFGSSAAVCSSSRRSFGVTMVDISSVRACRCPPLSNPTVVEMRSSRPSPSSFSFSIKKLRSPFLLPGSALSVYHDCKPAPDSPQWSYAAPFLLRDPETGVRFLLPAYIRDRL